MTITVKNDLTNWLNKFDSQRMKRDFLEKMGQEHIKIVRKRIQTEKADPNGQKWEPWAPSTKLGRERAGTASRGLLWDTGNLLESFRYDVRGNSVVIITDVPYAKYLNDGTNKMPARNFIGFGGKDLERTKVIWKRILKNG